VHNSANKGAVNGELIDLNALNSNTSSAAGSLAAAIPSLVAFPAPFNETTDVKATADSKLKVRESSRGSAAAVTAGSLAACRTNLTGNKLFQLRGMLPYLHCTAVPASRPATFIKLSSL
jgi:hypothetical protein